MAPTAPATRAVKVEPDRTLVLLEKIAWNTKVAAFRLGVIELVIFFVLVMAPFVAALLRTHAP